MIGGLGEGWWVWGVELRENVWIEGFWWKGMG